MNKEQKAKIRTILMQYPDTTEESIEQELIVFEQREELKKNLMTDRGFSNTLAERFLDKQGWSRPPGWHSIFFYPGSNTPRSNVIIFPAAIFILIWFVWF